ncbi:MAG TPA: hypothetical protein VEZ70_15200 [Allosphingosinicella sp.]|nr:hypothetical protein [Allosphingosinicella sp.]
MMTSLAVSAAAALAVSTAGPERPAPQAEPVRNVVIVHGAFADASGWRGVDDELTGRGYNVRLVQNPLASLADDVAATRRVLARQQGPPRSRRRPISSPTASPF